MVAVIGSERVTQTLNIDMYSQYYGAGDGHSFCGEQYSIEISDQVPEWMSIMNTNFVTIGTSSPIHLEESFDLMVTIKRDDLPDIVRYFNSELQCTLGDPCDHSSGSRTPAVLSRTEPRCENYIQGEVLDNSYEDVWYAPRRPYMLTKVQIWKRNSNTSGFKLTYTLPDDESFIGWP